MVRAEIPFHLYAPPAMRQAHAWKALNVPAYAPTSRNCVMRMPSSVPSFLAATSTS